jgi:hypothetical protein
MIATMLMRGISFFGFGGIFLLISPKLRGDITGGLESLTLQMELYAPWSYVGGVVLLVLAFMVAMYRGAQAR